MVRRFPWPVAAALLVGCSGAGGPSKDAGGPERPPTPASRPTTSTTSRPSDRPVGPGLPAGWEIVPTANYSATQAGGEVVIRAKGENPMAGCETKFMQSVLRIWPPQYVLIRKRPEIGAAVMTPFEVTTSFRAAEPVRAVIVRDGAGRHEVNVGPQQGG